MSTPQRWFPAALIVTVASAACAPATARADLDDFEPNLAKGAIDVAEEALTRQLARQKDEEARFALGMTQFLKAVEGLVQANYKYGVGQRYARAIPGLRLPVPLNENPAEIGYEDSRNVVKQFLADLEKAEKTLAAVDTTIPVKVPLHPGRIRLDLDGDGEATDGETFWRIFRLFNAGVNQEMGEGFVVHLDSGDVHWLRGYTHFLMAGCEITLAHDYRELFERTAHLFYPKVDSPYDFLEHPDVNNAFDAANILDVIAFIHLINFEVKEPARMKNALGHLEAMVDQSRLSWKRILAETDDDREWIPNPEQTSVISNERIPRAVIDGWHEVLDEIEAILDGEKLIPFWRDYFPRGPILFGQGRMQPIPAKGRGINLRKVFTQPKRFDLMMWLQGTGVAPYLERGDLSTPETWGRLTRVFRGEFFGFAIWFN